MLVKPQSAKLTQPPRKQNVSETKSLVKMEMIVLKTNVTTSTDASSHTKNPQNANNNVNFHSTVLNGQLKANFPQNAKLLNVMKRPPVVLQFLIPKEKDANQLTKNANWFVNQNTNATLSPVTERTQTLTKFHVSTEHLFVTITKTALKILVTKKPVVSMNSKRAKLAASFVNKTAIAQHGESLKNLQTNANCHSVTNTLEVVTERWVSKLQNAKKPTNVKLQMTVQHLNLDPPAVSATERRNVVNTNVELIPIVNQEMKTNGDTAERTLKVKTNVPQRKNVLEMKVVMTRTHVPEISV